MTKFLNTVFLLALILATNSKLFVASNPINQEHGHQQSPLISHAILDDNGKFNISWDHSAEFIVFQVVAATTGYIGFGLSPTGSMTGADIFHAGVWDNGTAYHFDMYATGFTKPELDDRPGDWKLLNARETDGVTTLWFSRPINTCDDQDYPIGMDTTRIIWALGESDELEYHTPRGRGTKSVNLLSAPQPHIDLDAMQHWKMTLEIEMPPDDTTYWCSFHRGPQLNKKHHIVAFEPYLHNSLAIAHTHHFVMHACYKDPDSGTLLSDAMKGFIVDTGFSGNVCYGSDRNVSRLRELCREYVYVWAKGGTALHFPENVGYPIGSGEGVGQEPFYMLEIHYDNPERLSGLRFEAGVKVYYTDKIREMDAAQLVVGHDVSKSMTIPPNTSNFVTAGHCSSFCTRLKFPPQGITLFNALLHSHLSGRKLKLRHFRDGVELPWPNYDDHYDFNYQQNRVLNKKVILLPGDQITYECTTDTVWKGGRVVTGGGSTSDEMCVSFLWYYPKIPDFDNCMSTYPPQKGLADLGITNYTFKAGKLWINEPTELEGEYENSLSYKFHWTESAKRGLEDRRRYGEHDGMCQSRRNTWGRPTFKVGYPKLKTIYVPEDKCLYVSSTGHICIWPSYMFIVITSLTIWLYG